MQVNELTKKQLIKNYLSCLLHFPIAVLVAFIDWTLSPLLFPNRHKDLLYDPSLDYMPKEHKEAALRCFERVKLNDKQVQHYKLKAPFMLLSLLPKLPWSADYLPEDYWQYDNEVSINGDKGDWVWDDSLGRGVLQRLPEEDTPRVREFCYYLKGSHGRSAAARYVWLAIRNRASQYAYSIGAKKIEDTEYWGNIDVSPDNPGVLVRRMGSDYEIFAYKRFGNFVVRTRYGYKIGNALQYHQAKAMHVTIPFSIKIIKKK